MGYIQLRASCTVQANSRADYCEGKPQATPGAGYFAHRAYAKLSPGQKPPSGHSRQTPASPMKNPYEQTHPPSSDDTAMSVQSHARDASLKCSAKRHAAIDTDSAAAGGVCAARVGEATATENSWVLSGAPWTNRLENTAAPSAYCALRLPLKSEGSALRAAGP